MKAELIKHESGRNTYALKGEIVNSADFAFLDACIEEKLSVHLDLSGITYINSSGFGGLVEEAMNFTEARLELILSGLAPGIRKTLAVLGAEELLHFKD